MMAKPRAHQFDLSGGEPCLDFSNTLDTHPDGEEHLGTYRDLLDWGLQAGVIEVREAHDLQATATHREREAREALHRARQLRARIYTLFAGLAEGVPPAERLIVDLNRDLARALPRLHLVAEGDGFTWRWQPDPANLDRVLWPVVRNAADLLTSDEVQHVRQCASETCTWLFIDRSRNRRRRWCDMRVCGNRAKARRHYRRKKASATS